MRASSRSGEPSIMLVTCNRNADREGPQRPKVIGGSSGSSGELADSVWSWTKEAPTDGFLNERERLLGLTCVGFGRLRTELHRRQPIFGGFDTRLSLR
jgi:hypothetical protein